MTRAVLVLAAALTTAASTEGVWVLWFRTAWGTLNRLSAGPTRQDCLYVLGKLEPGASPGEILICLPALEEPGEAMQRARVAPPKETP